MSGKGMDTEDAFMLVPEIVDNGTISTFAFSGDRSDSKPVTMETGMVEADFGGKCLRASGAIMAAAFLSIFVNALLLSEEVSVDVMQGY
jgi:hypothetical protein